MKKSTRRTTIVICALAGALGAGLVQGADIRYQTSGDWFAVVPVDGYGWQNPTVPGLADTARFNWGSNTVTLDAVAPDVNRFQMGVDESGGLIVNSGGSLTAAGDSKVGNNGSVTGFLIINSGGYVAANGGWLMVGGADNVSGILTLNGGNMDVAGHLWAATGSSSLGTISVNGGTLSVGGMLGLGTVNAVDPSGGTASLTIGSGGLLALSNIHGAGTSIQPGSLIDISGTGELTLPGNFLGVMQSYIDDGKIVGDGIVGNLGMDLAKNPGFTTVFVPEPSAFALMGVAVLGLAVRRFRR